MRKNARKGKRMKIRINLDETLEEDEVVINCRNIDPQILAIQKKVSDIIGRGQNFVLYKDDKEFYVPLDQILFFETSSDGISAHTGDNMFQTKYRLYELEEMLPGNFIRVSKSTILNTSKIYSLTKNITSTSVVQFDNSVKEVYVSRSYYKALKIKLEERYSYER